MQSAENPEAPVISPLQGRQRLYFLLGLILLWPAIFIGDVFAFNDTISYLRGADTLAYKLFGQHHPFFTIPIVNEAVIPATSPAEAGPSMVLYGRSIYFGLFLYVGLLAGSLWVPILAQAMAAGALIVAMVRHFVDPVDRSTFLRACLITFAVAACTPLAFFVCYLMPDLAVGLALPAMALMLVGWERERLAWRYFLFGVCLFAAFAHSTAVAMFLIFGAGALLIAGKRRSVFVAVPAALVLLAGLGGMAGEATFGAVTRITTGAETVRPPFLTARLIEDGPARRYLAEHCADNSPFTLCRYPVAGDVTAEIFLWDEQRPQGGFKALPVPDAVAVADEQYRFAFAVARAYPVETVVGLGRSIVRLATNFSMEEFRPEFVAEKMDPHILFEAVPADTPLPLVLRIMPMLTTVLVLAALMTLPWVIGSGLPTSCKQTVYVVLGALVVNDVVCACLSGPFARYNMRGIWALILVSLVCALHWHRSRNGASSQSGA